MRLDLLLKQTGLIKRRTVAKEIVERGRVLLNGRSCKPSSEVKENDQITLRLGLREIVVKVYFELKYNREIPHCEELSNRKVNEDA